MWDDLMKKSKAAGINLIETYVFWNLHQPEPDMFNFEGQANVLQFLQIAQQNGMWVNLRIGPYVCAEWNFGGFPEWLKELDGVVFRDYNAPYMREMAKFMETITDYLRPMFASNGGPIILAQVENEYGWLEKKYGANGTKYAEWAIEYARSLNIGVPWIMCSQDDMPLAINTCNGFYCDDWLAGHFQKFPNQPALWTENWPGWFQDWGQGKPKRPAVDVAYSAVRWFARGGTHMNYYMWHGGTTFARWPGGPGITNSYDYDAPIDEYGFPINLNILT